MTGIMTTEKMPGIEDALGFYYRLFGTQSDGHKESSIILISYCQGLTLMLIVGLSDRSTLAK